MPRPKGSKNKATLSIDERMEALTGEIEALKAQVAQKENELVALKNLKDEEKVKALMNTIASKGKSIDDVIAMINQDEGIG